MQKISTCIPAMIKTIQSPCNYADYWQQLEGKGKVYYGEDFYLRETDAEVWMKLICWTMKDEKVAAATGICLDKGILLSGPIGVGKTSMMHLVRQLAGPARNYRMKSCRDVSFEFSGLGVNVIYKYTRESYVSYPDLPGTICFDDLGLEMEVKDYGVSWNLMAEILLSRYDHFIHHGMLTHVTTNLNSKEIEARYGKRLRSRMRQMFNVVAFSQGTADKRI